MNYYISVLKKYAVFSGRAKRAEYWYFLLFNVIVVIILGSINSTLLSIYQSAVIIPAIAVGIRRMHDVNKSGWFLIIPVYNFILVLTDGTRGDNKYGSNPKDISNFKSDNS